MSFNANPPSEADAFIVRARSTDLRVKVAESKRHHITI
jgi:hypothetical protein